MPRQYQPVEYNTFVGGLVTEASPLTFPQNASLDEENFVLNKDGSRSRRLGVAFEDGYEIVTSGESLNADGSLVTSSFKWVNAGGLSTNTIICVQIGKTIDFFHNQAAALSTNRFFTYTFTDLTAIEKFSYASVDGKLVVATGGTSVTVFNYNTSNATITSTSRRLLIRDLFGLEDRTTDGTDLKSGNNISLRPTSSGGSSPTGAHIYNLRNQTWAVPRAYFDNETAGDSLKDALGIFSLAATREGTVGIYPSNADSVIPNLYANTNIDDGSKTLLRLDGQNAVVNPGSNSQAPTGYFIIDALDRGTSRTQAINSLYDKYPQNDANFTQAALSGIKPDLTPSGAACVCEYAGRVFYSGFSGEVIGGDDNSPKMSSYVLFSQLVNDDDDIINCYQEADPTDANESDLVDTDGGFLRCEGAYNIIGMATLQSTLFVMAQNGIWTISGGSSNGFTATNYQVSKLTNAGCISQGSIIVMQDSIFYWGLDGIYSITRNQYGDFSSANITDKTIKTFYMGISDQSIKNAEGIYDSYTSTVRWLYNNYIGAPDDVIELNLDINTGAYFRHRIKNLDGQYPMLMRGIQTDPYRIDSTNYNVQVDDDDVVVGSDSVVVSEATSVAGVKEIIYFILTAPSVPV